MRRVGIYKYRALSSGHYIESDLDLKPVKPSEIESIRTWRNAQLEVLRQKRAISKRQQRRYFRNEVFADYSNVYPRQILFSIRESGELIGYAGLVHIDWSNQRAEVSFLLDPRISEGTQRYTGVFKSTLRILKRVAFSDLGLNRIFTETFSGRSSHVDVLVSCGFVEEGRMREHIFHDGTFRDSQIHAILKNGKENFDG
jgi:RimJ/RimL family protein N-acetyltransferase